MLYFSLHTRPSHRGYRRQMELVLALGTLMTIYAFLFPPPTPSVAEKNELRPRGLSTLLEVANVAVEQYRHAEARELLRRAEDLNPRSAEAKALRGKMLFRGQDYAGAADALAAALRLDANLPQALFYAAKLQMIYRQRPTPDEYRVTQTLFHRAFTQDPTLFEALIQDLRISVLTGHGSEALETANHLIKRDSDNPAYFWARAVVYREGGDAVQAEQAFRDALARDSRFCPARLGLADLLAEKNDGNDGDGAINEYRIAARQNGCREGLYRAAEMQLRRGEYSASEDLLQQLVTVAPDFPDAYRMLGQAAASRGDATGAMQWMNQELVHNPMNYRARVDLAEHYFSLNQWKEVIPLLSRLADSAFAGPRHDSAVERRGYLLLSRAYRMTDRFQDAQAILFKAREIASETTPPDRPDPELARELDLVAHRQNTLE